MDQRRKIKLKVSVPFLEKGSEYWLYDSSGKIFWIDLQGNVSDYHLRPGLAGYIWMLTTDPKYVKILEKHWEDS